MHATLRAFDGPHPFQWAEAVVKEVFLVIAIRAVGCRIALILGVRVESLSGELVVEREDRLVPALVGDIALFLIAEMRLFEEAGVIGVVHHLGDGHLGAREAHAVDREDREHHARAYGEPAGGRRHARRRAGGLGVHAGEGHAFFRHLLQIWRLIA